MSAGQGPRQPTPAGIYDFLIGGTHNMERDRTIAQKLTDRNPIVAQGARHNREFLWYAARQMAKAARKAYIDFGTGYPTQEYLHEHVAPDAKIIYNDRDPLVVAEGQRLVEHLPNIRYIQAKIEDIDTILAAAEEHFDEDRVVGLMLVGVIYFIDDDSLRRVFRRLYDWSAPGSCLALSAFLINPEEPNWRLFLDDYKATGATVYFRTQEEVLQLAAPWQPPEDGLQPFHEFLEAELGGPKLVTPPLRGHGNLGFGGILTR